MHAVPTLPFIVYAFTREYYLACLNRCPVFVVLVPTDGVECVTLIPAQDCTQSS
jgi:hypothetical protein